MKDIKIGMRVRVKTSAQLCKEFGVEKACYALNFNREGCMDRHCGKVFTVIATGSLITLSTPKHAMWYQGDWEWHPKALEIPNKRISLKGIQCK